MFILQRQILWLLRWYKIVYARRAVALFKHHIYRHKRHRASASDNQAASHPHHTAFIHSVILMYTFYGRVARFLHTFQHILWGRRRCKMHLVYAIWSLLGWLLGTRCVSKQFHFNCSILAGRQYHVDQTHTHLLLWNRDRERPLQDRKCKFRELFTNYLRFYIFLTHIYCCNFPAIASYGNESNLFGRMTISLLPLPLRIYARALFTLPVIIIEFNCWMLFPRLVRMHRPTINNVCDVPEMRCEKKNWQRGANSMEKKLIET